MSLIDKALGALTPPESDAKRAEATQKARAAAQGQDWLAVALDHHDQIRQAFARARQASTASARIESMQALAAVLNGHSLAEEVVLYPALAKAGGKGHAGMAYTEQTTAKMQMAELERIDPASEAWMDKLEHIRGAVLHHIYEEEGGWFLELKRDYDDQAFLTRRFIEEYERYARGVAAEDGSGVSREPRSFRSEPSQPPA